MRKSFLTGRRNPSRYRRLRAEPLESRQLLTITVDTLIDEADGSIVDGDVSLRDAIALAPSGETIDFSVNGTILLTLGELVIDKDLTIDGPGSALLTIDAQHGADGVFGTLDGDQIFDVDDGEPELNRNVTISGLTLTGADAFDRGGAIGSTENLAAVDLIVTDNTALNGGGGIAISAVAGTITISHCLISGNYSVNARGGGIYVDASEMTSLEISDSTVRDNMGFSDDGMSLLLVNSTGLIRGSSVIGNRGVGIDAQNVSGSLTIRDVTIADNDSVGASIRTGGTSAYSLVFDSAVIGNRHGGLRITSAGGTTIVRETEIVANSIAFESGGGIRAVVTDGGNVLIDTSNISNNTANDGGGVSASGIGTVVVSNSTISGNTVTTSGGGLSLSVPTEITNTTIHSNTAQNGAGFNAFPGANATISNSTIAGNNGGGFRTVGIDTETRFIGCTVYGNTKYGGAIVIGEVEFQNSIVAGNRLSDGTPSDFYGTVAAGSSHNLFGVDTDVSGIVDGVDGNMLGTIDYPIDPFLGPLQDNGGPTLTHAPLPGGPVIDAGDAAFVAPPHTDQRGFYRVVDGDGDMTARIDIGAVEYGSVTPLPGDGNLDRSVDGLDYVLWAENFGDDPPDDLPGAPLNGDFNGDGVVNGLDYVLWATHFGETVATTSAAENVGAVEAALNADVESKHNATTSRILRYRLASADDGEVTSAVDAVFEELFVKKRMRRRIR